MVDNDNAASRTDGDVTNPAGLKTVDASWWEEVTLSSDAAEFEPAEVLHDSLQALAEAAELEEGASSLRTRTLRVMARATSAMLDPDSWDEPFTPAVEWSGKRTVIPSDLEQSELTLLADVLPLVEPAVLKARIADVVWTYGRPRDPSTAVVATEAYLAVPMDWDAWARTGRDGCRRATQLARHQGKAGAAALKTIATKLLEFLSTGEGPAFLESQVSQVLRSTGQVTAGQATELGRRLAARAAEMSAAHPSERALLREASAWLHRANMDEEALSCQVRIADSYSAEAEARVLGERGALVATGRLEQSLAVLRSLPRKYRDAHGLDEVLAERQRRLRELRQYSLEEMTPVGHSTVDVQEWVTRAREHVSGRDRPVALFALARIAPLFDVAEQTEDVRSHLADSLLRLMSRSTLSSDARKVADRVSDVGEAPSEQEVVEELVRRNTHRIGLVVQALIVPATESLTAEHRFDMAFVEGVCRESPTVPIRQVHQWARGLWHGLNGDFPSAVCMLVPQVEQMLRMHLKDHGVHTLFIGDRGVETEKALGALLDTEEATTILGPNLVFELRAVLLEQVGPNLRNELAHGLLTDGTIWSAPSVYVWWLCLRMVLAPLALDESVVGTQDDSAAPI